MISVEQFGQALYTLNQVTFLTVILAMIVGRMGADVLAFVLSHVPAYRQWQRKRNRAERIEFAAYMRDRREGGA